MKSARPTAVSITVTFAFALVFYIVAYQWLSKRQTARGPWEVVFTNSAGRVPTLIIHQSQLGLSNVIVHLAGEQLSASNATGTVRFTTPNTPVPFGQVLYDDLMFLPGDVTLDVFGHVVEMLPRVLVVNGTALEWKSGARHTLSPTNKLSAEARQQLKGGYRR